MKALWKTMLFLLGLLCFLLVQAQSGGDFAITRSTIDGGGSQSIGGVFVLTGTVGQADASESITGGAIELQGGFWVSENKAPVGDEIFSDGFE